jgi:hypothetical protein
MTRSDVSCLQGFQLLLRAKFVRLKGVVSYGQEIKYDNTTEMGRTYHLEIGGCERRLMVKARKVVSMVGERYRNGKTFPPNRAKICANLDLLTSGKRPSFITTSKSRSSWRIRRYLDGEGADDSQRSCKEAEIVMPYGEAME